MSNPVSDLAELLRSMEPVLNDGVYVYASVPRGTDISQIHALATFREAEGITLITSEAEARRASLPVLFRAAWITLKVHSDLHAVGLTAAFSRALGEAGISCNVVAAAYHDHIFVPVELATQAMARLRSLQEDGAGAKGSVQLPLGKPIPFPLITRIVKFRAKENLERVEAKKKKR